MLFDWATGGIHGYSYSSNLQMLLDSHRITLNQYNIVYEYLLSRRVCVYLAYNCNLYNSLSRVVSEKGSQEKIGMGFLKKKKTLKIGTTFMYGTREINIALYPPQRVLISPPQSFFSGLTSASFPIHRITMLSLTHILQNLIFHFFSLLAKCQKKN